MPSLWTSLATAGAAGLLATSLISQEESSLSMRNYEFNEDRSLQGLSGSSTVQSYYDRGYGKTYYDGYNPSGYYDTWYEKKYYDGYSYYGYYDYYYKRQYNGPNTNIGYYDAFTKKTYYDGYWYRGVGSSTTSVYQKPVYSAYTSSY
jgi:hypothetical protein